MAGQRIFVKYYGFGNAERHALETVFRLSESRETVYAQWAPGVPEKPQILLIDGDNWEAVLALANPANDGLKLIWVGAGAPDQAWRVFSTPVKWSAVVEAMDQAVALSVADLLLSCSDDSTQLDLGEDTSPAPLEAAGPAVRRVLVVDAGRDERLYLRAKLASAGLYQIDEAASGAEALACLQTQAYQLVIVDLGLTDMDSWQLIKAIDKHQPAIAHLFVTGLASAWPQGWRARLNGAQAYLKKPLHPEQLHSLFYQLSLPAPM